MSERATGETGATGKATPSNPPGGRGGQRLRRGAERPVRDRRLLARLLGYVRAHPLLLVVAALLVLVSDLLHVLVPYLTKIGIDRDVAAGDLAGLGRTTLLLCAALVGQLGGQVAFTYTVEYLGQRLLYDLRMSLFQKVLGLGHDYFDRTAVGATLTNVTNDVEAIRQFISQGLVSLLGDSFQVAMILGAMLLINPRLALAAFITLPFFGVVTWAVSQFDPARLRRGARGQRPDQHHPGGGDHRHARGDAAQLPEADPGHLHRPQTGAIWRRSCGW